MVKRSLLKIGKKLCFPDVPSTWVPRTVESILHRQDCFRRKPNLSEVGCEIDKSTPCNLLPTLNHYHYDDDYHHPPKDAYLWSLHNHDTVYHSIMNDQREVEDYRNKLKKEGQHFDVISLLKSYNTDYLVRNNGDKVVDSLWGKHILVVCVSAPFFWRFTDTLILRNMFTFYAQQNNNAKVKTELVVVPKLRRNWVGCADEEDAFNHFFSGFPSSWLAVPFSHTLCRDHICNTLGLSQLLLSLLVDPDQKVVFHRSEGFTSLSFCDPDNPEDWWKTRSQLDLILDLDPQHVFNTVFDDKKISISELKHKVVGLYLCYDGSFIRTLDIISRECKARNQEFEVVLVYLPYNSGVDPPLFPEAINHVLHNLNISDWWVSPFDDFVSRRLWEAVEFSFEDELVILDPHMNTVDPLAKSVLNRFGFNSYPFTRQSLVLKKLEELRAVTLDSLLVYGSCDHLLRIGNDNNAEEVSVAQLQGKTVILWVDEVETPPWPEAYTNLLDWYSWIKTTKAADDFEVVFVSYKPFGSPKLLPVPMPWLVCPFDLEHTKFVAEKTLKGGYRNYLVAFGKDGHIIKLRAYSFLKKCGPEGFPPCSNGLCKDIIHYFENNYDINIDPSSNWL